MHAAGQAAWDRAALRDSPLFHTVRPLIATLPEDDFPACDTLNALAEAQTLVNAQGMPLRFSASAVAESAAAYETSAYRDGIVPTRAHNYHDLYNALAWLTFPRTKATINRLHIEELARQPGARRSVARDVLTLFDEGGMIVACSNPSLTELLHGFRWKALFHERRAEVNAQMRFYIVGHALQEKAMTPYKGITAKAMCIPVDRAFFDLPMESAIAEMDRVAAERLPTMLSDTAKLQPIPILGIPGWCAENDAATYYDDTQHFRPGRMRARNVCP